MQFYGCSTVVLIGITCPAITVGTVILRALVRVRERAIVKGLYLNRFTVIRIHKNSTDHRQKKNGADCNYNAQTYSRCPCK